MKSNSKMKNKKISHKIIGFKSLKRKRVTNRRSKSKNLKRKIPNWQQSVNTKEKIYKS
jgi:hypothetical protein